MTLELRDISKSYENPDGTELNVLDGLSFEIEDESFTTIMGPSGCGKSTILNIIAGLLEKDGGNIVRDGAPVSPGSLPYAFVFQDPRLIHWLTVSENIRFALRSRDVPKAEHERRVEKYLSLVDLAGEEDTYPLQLSGGMRQRVGLARALAVESDILLMDEPFSALDELTAQNLRTDLLDLWQETDRTVVFITHNISEAVYLSDRIVFMNSEGDVFHEADIGIERPRSFQDKELLELESELMERFFDSVGADG